MPSFNQNTGIDGVAISDCEPSSATFFRWSIFRNSRYLVLPTETILPLFQGDVGDLCGSAHTSAELVSFDSQSEFDYVAELLLGAQHGYMRAPFANTCAGIGAYPIDTAEECKDAVLALGLHLNTEADAPLAEINDTLVPNGCMYLSTSSYANHHTVEFNSNSNWKAPASAEAGSGRSKNLICRAKSTRPEAWDVVPVTAWVATDHRWTPETVGADGECKQVYAGSWRENSTSAQRVSVHTGECTAPSTYFICEAPIKVNWEERDRYRYMHVQAAATWEEARLTCEALEDAPGSHLIRGLFIKLP